MALIGLDVGGTGAKATVFSDAGEILASAYREYNMVSPNPGWYEYVPDDLYEAARAVLREAASGCAEKVVGIGVSSFGESVVCQDADGRVLANTMMYLDNRGMSDYAELVAAFDPAEFQRRNGTPPRVNHTLVMLHVMKRTMPGVLEKTKTLHFVAGYILSKFGGGHMIDYSVACTSGGVDIGTLSWRRDLFEWAGLDPDLLPELVPPGTCVGELSRESARDLGLEPGVKLVIGGLDHVPSAIGAAVRKKGQVMNAIGTVDGLFFVTDTADPRLYAGDYLFLPHYTPGHYGAMLANLAGGVLLKWFRDHVGRYEKAAWAEAGLDFYAEYEKQMAQSPTNLIVLPRFGGRGAQLSDRAGILNMTLSTTNEELYRAFMEGETFEMYTMLRGYIGGGHPVSDVTCVGGAARCDTYMQLRADVFDRPVYTVACDQPGALGDAMAAGVAAGVFPSIEEAIQKIVRRRKSFLPDPGNHAYYMEQYEKYLKIYAFLREIEG